MKKILVFLMALFMFTLVSCAQSPDTTTSEVSEQNSSVPQNFTLNEDFALVYSEAASDREKEIVTSLSVALGRLGIVVETYPDSEPEEPYEILIGQTNRSSSKSAKEGLGVGGFSLKTDRIDNGTKIVLCANDEDGLELGARYFIFKYLNKACGGTLPNDLFFTHNRSELMLNGTPITDYTIVYAREGVGSDKDIQTSKYADTVLEFAKLLELAIGNRFIPMADEGNLSSDKKYILFGSISCPEDNIIYNPTFLASSVGTYTVKLLNNGNLAVAGSNACSALAAGEAAVFSMLGKNGEVGKINQSGKKDILRVACVGDSITYGTNSNDPSMQSYPVYLQRMLGYNYAVEKYGAPSHSLIETDTPSFLKHDYFKKSVNAKPDIVIVMLGTNDCRTQKWEDSAYKDWRDPARKEAFLSSGQKLIDAYRKKNPDVQIIFSTCPTVPQDAWLATDWTARIRQYGNPSIKILAQNNNCPVIDIFTYSTRHPEMFEGGDGLHPQNEQYEILAKGVYDLSKEIIKK